MATLGKGSHTSQPQWNEGNPKYPKVIDIDS